MARIVHLSSLHTRYDTRIFVKMCVTLASHDYDVTYVVADGSGSEVRDGVRIDDVGLRAGGRFARMRKTTRRLFDAALALDADVYHLHDPELIPGGLMLKRRGKIVIFDAHEDLPEQIRNKPYLNPLSRAVLAWIFARYQQLTLPRFDALVGATPLITGKLSKINPLSVNVNNFPVVEEFDFVEDWSSRLPEVTYLGGIAEIRGIKQNVLAMGLTRGVRLNLAGSFSEPATEAEVRAYPAWSLVNELGFLDRGRINALLARSMAGLVTLHPVSNYIDSQPVKMFEYMAAGIPVIASNFPSWREVVEGNDCGLCVDPMDVSAIAAAIQFLVDNPRRAQEMGRNGRMAVERKFNWNNEAARLLQLYERLVP